jgi:hypothetical protein
VWAVTSDQYLWRGCWLCRLGGAWRALNGRRPPQRMCGPAPGGGRPAPSSDAGLGRAERQAARRRGGHPGRRRNVAGWRLSEQAKVAWMAALSGKPAAAADRSGANIDDDGYVSRPRPPHCLGERQAGAATSQDGG